VPLYLVGIYSGREIPPYIVIWAADLFIQARSYSLLGSIGVLKFFDKRYRIAKCAAKSNFREAKSALYRKLVLINFVII